MSHSTHPSTRAAALAPAERRRSLALVILHMVAIGMTMGLTIPLTSLVLEGWAVDTWLIGVVAAMPAAAILLFMPHFPRIIGRLGAVPSMLCGCVLGLAAILLQPLFPTVAAWAALRFVLGAALALPWLVGETWINSVALDATRGRTMALYAASLFAGFAAGPLLLDAVGAEGWPPFLLAAGALAGAVVPLLFAGRLAPPMPAQADLQLRQVTRAAPTVAAAALVAGLLEGANYALLPLYTLRNGLSQELSLQILTAFLVGGIVLQFPTGWLADRLERHVVLGGLGLGAGLAALLLPGALGTGWATFALAFVLGGFVLGFYTVGLALLGQRFRPADLAVANAVFILLYEAGTFAGPGLAGMAMDLWTTHGLVFSGAAVSFAFGVGALLRAGATRGRSRLDPEQ